MVQGNLTGGIYSRPVAMGNVTYFIIGGIVLTKAAHSTPSVGLVELTPAALHILLATMFAYVAFTHPNIRKKQNKVGG
ncbi:MAG: hypothetical protein WBH03_10745 [Cyclobacteriaceae bacterium]